MISYPAVVQIQNWTLKEASSPESVHAPWLGVSYNFPIGAGTGLSEPETSQGYVRMDMTPFITIHDDYPDNPLVDNHSYISWPQTLTGWGEVTTLFAAQVSTRGDDYCVWAAYLENYPVFVGPGVIFRIPVEGLIFKFVSC